MNYEVLKRDLWLHLVLTKELMSSDSRAKHRKYIMRKVTWMALFIRREVRHQSQLHKAPTKYSLLQKQYWRQCHKRSEGDDAIITLFTQNVFGFRKKARRSALEWKRTFLKSWTTFNVPLMREIGHWKRNETRRNGQRCQYNACLQKTPVTCENSSNWKDSKALHFRWMAFEFTLLQLICK